MSVVCDLFRTFLLYNLEVLNKSFIFVLTIMKKYRIIKISEGNYTYFQIQKKILFFWVDAYIPCFDSIRLSTRLEYKFVRFNSKETAQKVALMLTEGNVINYRGYSIHKGYYWLDDSIIYGFGNYYMYTSNSLQEIKDRVDKQYIEDACKKENPKTIEVIEEIKG